MSCTNDFLGTTDVGQDTLVSIEWPSTSICRVALDERTLVIGDYYGWDLFGMIFSGPLNCGAFCLDVGTSTVCQQMGTRITQQFG